MSAAVASSVDEVIRLYEDHGPAHYDEDLGQLDHALQCAALARSAGASDPLVAAALLHAVGPLLHLAGATGDDAPTGSDADRHHEATGSAWLAGLFPATVTAPIALHVRAKRYLVTVDPAYEAALSAGSTASLQRQGGPLPAAEVRSFEANPGWSDAVALRRWDDRGKVDGLRVAALATYRPLLEALAGP